MIVLNRYPKERTYELLRSLHILSKQSFNIEQTLHFACSRNHKRRNSFVYFMRLSRHHLDRIGDYLAGSDRCCAFIR
jgi:hypothetical protein